eukprot:7681466-Pyramimonas_sp.AAC.1
MAPGAPAGASAPIAKTRPSVARARIQESGEPSSRDCPGPRSVAPTFAPPPRELQQLTAALGFTSSWLSVTHGGSPFSRSLCSLQNCRRDTVTGSGRHSGRIFGPRRDSAPGALMGAWGCRSACLPIARG